MTNDLRDKIIEVLPPFQDGYILPEDVADAILAKLEPEALIVAALEAAADMIAEYTTSQHVAHDMRVGIFPEQSPKREAMAGDIRALAADPEAIAAIKAKAGWSE